MPGTAREAVIIAEPDRALVELCGISILERLLRILQRLGLRRASIVSSSPEEIRRHLATPSWARSEIVSDVVGADAITHNQVLFIDGGSYFDPRLLRAMLATEEPAVLVDSAPPRAYEPLLTAVSSSAGHRLCGVAFVDGGLRFSEETHAIFERLAALPIARIDVRDQPTYVTSLRRDIRPLWFPAPRPANVGLAEDLLLDAAQNGTLDLPAIAHAPIETAIVRRLCRTRVTPMQITLFTAAVSAVVCALFASGNLLLATSLALIVGVLDGLDGKQARVKVETTELGKREHVLDYLLELSWWTALAYHFATGGALPNAYALLLLLLGSDLVDRYAKRIAKQRTGRNLDDLAPIDRFVRLIGGRRNIYIWMLAIGLAVGAADKAFALLCYWGAGTAAVHTVRAVWIARQPRRA
jgi:1L-myo-inositol 1-phosphate cytidylyltransferase / CDP-L-myo-inositol myo-inositolphosphotransferase